MLAETIVLKNETVVALYNQFSIKKFALLSCWKSLKSIEKELSGVKTGTGGISSLLHDVNSRTLLSATADKNLKLFIIKRLIKILSHRQK